MTQASSMFNLHDSFREIEDYIVVDFDPRSKELTLTEHEDHEVSAQSFLVELNTMGTLPSMKMPVPRCNRHMKAVIEEGPTAVEATAITDISSSKNQIGTKERSVEIDIRMATRRRRERNWAKITRNLSAAAEEDAIDNPTTSDPGDSDEHNDQGEKSTRPRYPPLESDSDSPETDPDFIQTSSSDSEWVVRSDMVGLSVSDSLHRVASDLAKGIHGVVVGSENVGSERLDDTETKSEIGKTESLEIEEGEDDSKDQYEDAKKHQTRNLSLAASAITVMLAAIWMTERHYI